VLGLGWGLVELSRLCWAVLVFVVLVSVGWVGLTGVDCYLWRCWEMFRDLCSVGLCWVSVGISLRI
jgi:hypothetical protein